MMTKDVDFMRTNLVMQFHCADCGNQLKLTYSEKKTNDLAHDMQEPKIKTGSAVMRNRILIHPCSECKRKAEEPINHLKKALQGAKIA